MKIVLCLAAAAALGIAGILYACIIVGTRMDDQFQEYTRMKEEGGDVR